MERTMHNRFVVSIVSTYLMIPFIDKHSYLLHCDLDSRNKSYKSVELRLVIQKIFDKYMKLFNHWTRRSFILYVGFLTNSVR